MTALPPGRSIAATAHAQGTERSRPQCQDQALPVERSSSYLGCTVIRKPLVGALLSFNGGFVDTAGFLGLQGLFAAHVTGNFVTLAATLAFGAHGVAAKLLVLPEFILVVALARVVGATLAARDLPAFRILPSSVMATRKRSRTTSSTWSGAMPMLLQ